MGLFDIFKKKRKEENEYEEEYEDEYGEDDYEGETLSVYDAADIWASNGKDEDYTFGYSEQELEDAFNK